MSQSFNKPQPFGAVRSYLSIAFCLVCISCASPQVTIDIDRTQLESDLRTLSSDAMAGRETGTEGGQKAKAFLVERMQQLELQPVYRGYEQEFEATAGTTPETARTMRGTNLVGKIQGTRQKGSSIVLTAHYDHVGVRSGEIYNGADDNASGVAALLAASAYFQENRPEHDLIFVFLDAEEFGLQGAQFFVESAKPEIEGCIALNVNLDMVSRNNKNELYVAGLFHYPHLKPVADQIAASSPVTLKQGHDRPEDGQGDWTLQSDHGAFHRAGIPFLYFGVEDHKDYHQPSDVFETVPFDFFERSVVTITNAVAVLDKQLGDWDKRCG
jgi:hypothetical protein